MSAETKPGLLRRLTGWVVYLVVGLVLYALSMAVFFAIRGAGYLEGTGTFVLWVLVTLVLIGSLK